MIRIGLIARSDNSGLGVQSKEFFDHIPCKALVIDMTEMSNSPIITPHPERFPGQRVYRLPKGFKLNGGIQHRIINEFLEGLDLVFAMETAYDYNIFFEARKRGIKVILQLNYEFLDYPGAIAPPNLFASPSMWYYDQIPDPKKFLPVPVNTEKIKVQSRQEKTFIHIAGRPAFNDRNGTQILAESLQYLKSNIKLIVHSQQSVIFRNRNRKANVELDYTNKENYWENYTGGVLILPRKYGGLCLPFNEALAAGMPVITTDCSPNNTWLPTEWLVPARERGILHCKRKCSMFEMNARLLAQKIDEFCDTGFYNQACDKALMLKDTISWDTLLPLYHQTFTELC